MTVKFAASADTAENLVQKTGLRHIAIIMDGNRRWAQKKRLPSIAGHNEGVKALEKTVQAAVDFGIKYLTVYAFSTENWGRKKEEVDFLMFLLKETLRNKTKEFNKKGVKIKIIGNTTSLSEDLKKALKDSEELTANNDKINLQIAINYGARSEITNAVKNIAADVKSGKLNPEIITEELISSYLYTSDVPDPDLLIRTGGEQRISNYLLWQIAYTEIYITETFWPEFGEVELLKSVQEFAGRQRRFGRD
jgi:undecaprenyl diphosphate synthase